MYIYNASPNLNNSTPAKFNQVIIADGILTLDRKCKFNLENGTRGEGGGYVKYEMAHYVYCNE